NWGHRQKEKQINPGSPRMMTDTLRFSHRTSMVRHDPPAKTAIGYARAAGVMKDPLASELTINPNIATLSHCERNALTNRQQGGLNRSSNRAVNRRKR